jgi:hypothetical protein
VGVFPAFPEAEECVAATRRKPHNDGVQPREPNKPPPRRWGWRRYSLSTLLIVVAMVGVALRVLTDRAQRQRRAVAQIRELGGSARYGFELGAPRGMPGPDWLRRILGVDYFADVVQVHAYRMTDATCSDLSASASLRRLYLDEPEMTDAGLAHLAGLTTLEDLYLGGGQFTDAGLAHLAGLTRLEWLALGNTQITDAGLSHLAGLSELQWLDLTGTQVTDAGLAHLAGLASLKNVYLAGTQVTPEGRAKLRRSLPNCRVHD